ncbi:hypothetical protein BJF79_24075 [Actinomadura sp. CNU-125]|uniref:hypothetical protein n=1 Tax=Actinomadura sp. CNU-125 TaxID=1904961 RepID=UPI00095CDD09|nr:hypothetical protein [Actinomadura sp. CNU-125]OLT11555.1 hypothetical protein BJF79_24075 [Actinomadura sp. CNU-125]
MTSAGAALRIARRDALRAKGRTAFVLCMIGLPVAAIVALGVVWQTSAWSRARPCHTNSARPTRG